MYSSAKNGFTNYGAIGAESSLDVSKNKYNSSVKKGLTIFFGIFLMILIGIYCVYDESGEFNSLFMVNDDGTGVSGVTGVTSGNGINNNNNFNSVNGVNTVNSQKYYQSLNFLSVTHNNNNNNNNNNKANSGSSTSINNNNNNKHNVNANPISPVSNEISKVYGSILMSRARSNENAMNSNSIIE